LKDLFSQSLDPQRFSNIENGLTNPILDIANPLKIKILVKLDLSNV